VVCGGRRWVQEEQKDNPYWRTRESNLLRGRNDPRSANSRDTSRIVWGVLLTPDLVQTGPNHGTDSICYSTSRCQAPGGYIEATQVSTRPFITAAWKKALTRSTPCSEQETHGMVSITGESSWVSKATKYVLSSGKHGTRDRSDEKHIRNAPKRCSRLSYSQTPSNFGSLQGARPNG
jgi:hypothetical protein